MAASVLTSPTLVRRDLKVAAAVLVLSALATLIGLSEDVRLGSVTSTWWHLLPAAGGALAVVGQRRFPLPAMVLALLSLGVGAAWGWGLGAVMAAWEVLYTAATTWPWTWVRLLRQAAIGSSVAIALAAGIIATDLRLAANVGLLTFAVLVTPVWWGTDVRRQTDLARFAKERAEHQRQAGVRDERARMARDLHDAVAGDLASIALHAEAGLRTAPEGPARNALNAIRGSSVRAVDELTRMITLLRRDGEQRAEDITTSPGLDRVHDLIAQLSSTGLRVDADVTLPDRVPMAVDHAGYRIVQEALTNASRHGCGEARVRLWPDSEHLAIEVRSRARTGAPAPGGTGLGLLTMRERAEGLGGEFSAGWESAASQWWRVGARIPLRIGAGTNEAGVA